MTINKTPFKMLFASLLMIFSSHILKALEELPHPINSPESSFETNSPVYVVGDVHGAYASIVTTLKNISLIDDNNQWIGGTARFVSLGDLMDRGPSSRKVMDLYMALQTQAIKAGGKFHVVLGNHEIMNLAGDLRYLSAEEIAEFASDETIEQRALAFERYIKWKDLQDTPAALAEFDQQFPKGYFARQQAFSLSGKYGQWLTQLPFVIRINDQIFTHGGLSKKTEEYTIEELNSELNRTLVNYLSSWQFLKDKELFTSTASFSERQTLINALEPSEKKTQFLSSKGHFLFSNESPTWFRGNAICHPYFEQDNLNSRLLRWKATRLWVGHTTSQKRSPLNRLDGKLVVMDTGMLNSYYKGEPWVAKILANKQPVYIQGLTGKIGKSTLSPNRHWSNPYNMTDNQVEDFLKTAEITIIGGTKEGKTKPLVLELRKNGKMIKGIFKYVDTAPRNQIGRWKKEDNYEDRYQYEMAAYRLDRILGIGLVPVTIERKIKRKSGIIQLWIDGLISEMVMKDNNITFVGDCYKKAQENMIDTFDYLISNQDRNQSNMLYSQDDMQIWFIDHSRSFSVKAKRPKMLRKSKIKLTNRFRQSLEKLNHEGLQVLRPWLHNRQIKAILKRRDKLVSGDF